MLHCFQFGWNWLSSSWEEVSLLLKKYFNCCSRCYMANIEHYPINQLIVAYVFVTICLSFPVSNEETHPKRFAPSLVGVNLVVLEKKIYKFRLCNFIFISLLEKDVIEVESPSHKNTLCQVWLKLALCFWRIFFKILSVYFRYFLINSLWKRTWPFIWTKLILLYPTALCRVWFKLVRRRLLRYVNVFQLLHYYLPFENCGHSFEQT